MCILLVENESKPAPGVGLGSYWERTGLVSRSLVSLVVGITDPIGRGLRRRSSTASLLGSRARIPLTGWMFVSVLSCVGRSLCDGQIARPDKS
jgi:hypothetical protein